jgi:hypothetical protein
MDGWIFSLSLPWLALRMAGSPIAPEALPGWFMSRNLVYFTPDFWLSQVIWTPPCRR